MGRRGYSALVAGRRYGGATAFSLCDALTRLDAQGTNVRYEIDLLPVGEKSKGRDVIVLWCFTWRGSRHAQTVIGGA